MKTPRTMKPLVQDGLIDEMIRPPNSGKEASVYAMACDGEMGCAKVCTEASQCGCHKQARCREGSNKVRVSRQAPHSASTGPSAGLARPRFQVPGYRPRNLVAGR